MSSPSSFCMVCYGNSLELQLWLTATQITAAMTMGMDTVTATVTTKPTVTITDTAMGLTRPTTPMNIAHPCAERIPRKSAVKVGKP
jgi:hypothetical protein